MPDPAASPPLVSTLQRRPASEGGAGWWSRSAVSHFLQSQLAKTQHDILRCEAYLNALHTYFPLTDSAPSATASASSSSSSSSSPSPPLLDMLPLLQQAVAELSRLRAMESAYCDVVRCWDLSSHSDCQAMLLGLCRWAAISYGQSMAQLQQHWDGAANRQLQQAAGDEAHGRRLLLVVRWRRRQQEAAQQPPVQQPLGQGGSSGSTATASTSSTAATTTAATSRRKRRRTDVKHTAAAAPVIDLTADASPSQDHSPQQALSAQQEPQQPVATVTAASAPWTVAASVSSSSGSSGSIAAPDLSAVVTSPALSAAAEQTGSAACEDSRDCGVAQSVGDSVPVSQRPPPLEVKGAASVPLCVSTSPSVASSASSSPCAGYVFDDCNMPSPASADQPSSSCSTAAGSAGSASTACESSSKSSASATSADSAPASDSPLSPSAVRRPRYCLLSVSPTASLEYEHEARVRFSSRSSLEKELGFSGSIRCPSCDAQLLRIDCVRVRPGTFSSSAPDASGGVCAQALSASAVQLLSSSFRPHVGLSGSPLSFHLVLSHLNRSIGILAVCRFSISTADATQPLELHAFLTKTEVRGRGYGRLLLEALRELVDRVASYRRRLSGGCSGGAGPGCELLVHSVRAEQQLSWWEAMGLRTDRKGKEVSYQDTLLLRDERSGGGQLGDDSEDEDRREQDKKRWVERISKFSQVQHRSECQRKRNGGERVGGGIAAAHCN